MDTGCVVPVEAEVVVPGEQLPPPWAIVSPFSHSLQMVDSCEQLIQPSTRQSATERKNDKLGITTI